MKSVAAGWRFMFLLLFLGWLFIWVMLPTKTYKFAWTPKLKDRLNSTYFREHGTNLALFTFPVILAAALGCVYLHFRDKSNTITSDSEGAKTRSCQYSSIKSPVLVVAPLGIVNSVELGFAAMFIALLIWSLANYLNISFNGHLHMDEGVKVWQSKFRSVSLRLGYIGNICWAFLFFPVARWSSILPLFGLSSESSIKYHIWLGHTSMILFAAHSIGFIIYWGMTDQMSQILEWSRTYVPNVAGVIAFVVSLGMWATSLYPVRRKKFEVFFYTHHLYILYIFFYILHVGAAYFCMILPGVFLFIIDRYIRFLQSRQMTRLVSARLLPCGTTELTFSKNPGLSYNPTSTLFLNVPSISKLQWHPFTIISSCNMEEDKLDIAIVSQGSWSQKLYKQLSSSVNVHLQVSTEGPYGPTSFHLLRHEALVMISGGSGITPFISIVREIIYSSTQPNCKVPKVILVVAFKNAADLSNLDLLLPGSATSIDISQLKLQIEVYITREQQAVMPTSDDAHKHLHTTKTLWFKPRPSDSPISAVFGPNSWLWLGTIISTSFIMFLIFLGILTRYWIYPTEKRGEIYHFSLKTLWDMFLACASVFIATSVIFFFKKRRSYAAEGTQIQNAELPTPTTSPVPAAGSCLSMGGADRELESLPNQPLAEATRVHFGCRPDLKRLLFDVKESDVGVLACGPRKMRHEVARICSSGLAHNLHFESISFNW